MGPEKKLFKRSFMLVSALALSVSLAACGDEEEVAETPAEPAVVEPVEPEVAVEPEVEPEAEVVEAEPVEPVEPVTEAPVAETPPTGVETQTVVVETVPATGAAGGTAATGGTATTGATQTAGATLPFMGRYAPSAELCEAADDPQIINFEADRFTAGGNQFEIQNVANEGDQFRVTAGTGTGAAEEVAFTPTQNGFEMETADGNFTYVFCPAG